MFSFSWDFIFLCQSVCQWVVFLNVWVYLCVSVRIVYMAVRGFVMAGVHIKWVCLDSCSRMYRAFGKFMHPCWQIHSILSPNTYTNQCINMYILCDYGLVRIFEMLFFKSRSSSCVMGSFYAKVPPFLFTRLFCHQFIYEKWVLLTARYTRQQHI